jgi:3-hydroxybutyryl-CoA dehydrogenase
MTVDGISRICVVGAGSMGHQISLAAAVAGYAVTCTDREPAALVKAEEFANKWLPGRVAKGRLTQEQTERARANLSFTSRLEDAACNADFVIEAIVEQLGPKRELFARLDALCPEHAILATNSSFIVSSRIADATRRPDRVCNMHFFYPALVMKLVEVVKGAHVSDETARITLEVAHSMGKVAVLLQKEVRGFLVNRILMALSQEAFWLYESGVASLEDIDLAVVNGLNHPMGPFQLADLSGLDLGYDVAMERFRETGDPADRPWPSIVEHYVRGEWGRKTGKGFYDYTGAE